MPSCIARTGAAIAAERAEDAAGGGAVDVADDRARPAEGVTGERAGGPDLGVTHPREL